MPLLDHFTTARSSIVHASAEIFSIEVETFKTNEHKLSLVLEQLLCTPTMTCKCMLETLLAHLSEQQLIVMLQRYYIPYCINLNGLQPFSKTDFDTFIGKQYFDLIQTLFPNQGKALQTYILLEIAAKSNFFIFNQLCRQNIVSIVQCFCKDVLKAILLCCKPATKRAIGDALILFLPTKTELTFRLTYFQIAVAAKDVIFIEAFFKMNCLFVSQAAIEMVLQRGDLLFVLTCIYKLYGSDNYFATTWNSDEEMEAFKLCNQRFNPNTKFYSLLSMERICECAFDLLN